MRLPTAGVRAHASPCTQALHLHLSSAIKCGDNVFQHTCGHQEQQLLTVSLPWAEPGTVCEWSSLLPWSAAVLPGGKAPAVCAGA